jgi:hypothetical protein
MTNASVSRHDDGSKPSMYDLTLTWPDKRKAAMEVTRSTDELLMTIWGGINHRALLAARLTAHSWTVFLDRATKMRKAQARIDEHLASIEAEDLVRFGPVHLSTSPAARTLWKDLRISRGFVYDRRRSAAGEPLIALMPPAPPQMTSASAVQEEVERQASLPDNVDKLERSGKGERHLFIWIDMLHPAWRALAGPLPGVGPSLPKAVTTVWVANESLDDQGTSMWWTVWRADRASGWARLGMMPSPAMPRSLLRHPRDLSDAP